MLQSARTRREVCTGRWLPEPVEAGVDAGTGTGAGDDPASGAERAEALDVAVLVLLERLTPTERAAYVLREAFDYSYGDIARIIRVSQVAARQLVSRARKHLATGKHATVVPSKRRALLVAFVTAARTGDLGGLEHLFAEDAVSQGGGCYAAGLNGIPAGFIRSSQ